MDTQDRDPEEIGQDKEYKKFIWSRIILGICIMIVLIWAAVYISDLFQPAKQATTVSAVKSEGKTPKTAPAKEAASDKQETESAEKSAQSHATAKESTESSESAKTSAAEGGKTPKGVTFMNHLVAPLEYELTQRFWGWRPNDILNFTDNVNEIQIGILEATRRGTVYLTERISRRGSAEALNPHLENAMNWLMVNPESYWFPSSENKYKDALSELKAYRRQLEAGQAGFYTRADNLIPLLKALEELLGSCDDNLVKLTEEDGDPVSTFHADNYFFYAKGVAMALDSILHGVEHDFRRTLDVRGGLDILHHAIHSCHIAAGLDPWLLVTEGSLSGIFANHRANMAAHVSHARFYLSLLVETLST